MGGLGALSGAEQSVEWVDWPLRDRWPVSLTAPASIVLCIAVVHLAFASPPLDAIAAVLLAASLRRYLLPVGVRAGAEGITVRFCLGRRDYAWSDFRGWRDVPHGLVLLLGRSGSRLREVFLPVPTGRDDAKRYVQDKVRQGPAGGAQARLRHAGRSAADRPAAPVA